MHRNSFTSNLIIFLSPLSYCTVIFHVEGIIEITQFQSYGSSLIIINNYE
jgi:hypothetical protein